MHPQGTYNAQIQPEIVALMLQVQLNLVQYRFDSFRLKAIPTTSKKNFCRAQRIQNLPP